MTHVAHVCFQLSDAIVLGRVQDHGEVTEVLLSLYGIVLLKKRGKIA